MAGKVTPRTCTSVPKRLLSTPLPTPSQGPFGAPAGPGLGRPHADQPGYRHPLTGPGVTNAS